MPLAGAASSQTGSHPKSGAAQVAQGALQLATSWSCHRPKHRNGTTLTTGIVSWPRSPPTPGAPASEGSGPRRARLRFSAVLAGYGTVGVICDEIDGLKLYPGYGLLRELFTDPALAADKRYSGLLRGYLESDTVGPLPIRRVAVAHPDTADAVFRKVLRKPSFTWADHGEALPRRRKPWYFEHEPHPGVSVISTRLTELAALR